MMKKISILGSTGSIGRNVLAVVRDFPERFRVSGLAAGCNIGLLRQQIEIFDPLLVSVSTEELASELFASLPGSWEKKIVWGVSGNEQVAALDEIDLTVSAIVGAAGLMPTMAAIKAGKDIALANKETLVMAGDLVMAEAARQGIKIFPIDSEHSAVAQALAAGRRAEVAKIILTASGGPFRQLSLAELREVTPDQALAHPNWDMGRKISIDSATLMNKGLEIIEARWLFDVDVDMIEVLVHPQSIVHSMVEFVDGSVMAQMGVPDMRVPISYALAWPDRLPMQLPRLDLARCRDLSFFAPDFERFPALGLAYRVCREGGTRPAVLNAANEVAVAAFLDKRIGFPEITRVVSETVAGLPGRKAVDVKTVIEADVEARKLAESIAADFSGLSA